MVRSIIFDIDGTLIDSLDANLSYFQNLMKAAGYRPPTKEEFIPLFHKPTREIIPILTDVTDEKEIERIFEIAHDSKIKSMPPILNEGAREVVALISERYPLGIATSRLRMYVFEPPLNALEHYFSIVAAYEDTENHKPSPEPLLFAASKCNVLPEECVYVGDAKTDLEAAHAAGMKFILYVKNRGQKLESAEFKSVASQNIGKIPDDPYDIEAGLTKEIMSYYDSEPAAANTRHTTMLCLIQTRKARAAASAGDGMCTVGVANTSSAITVLAASK